MTKKKLSKLKITEYPYGYSGVNKTLRNAVKWLNLNKIRLSKLDYYFDYPNYWDMPKTISSRLSTDQVDWIQDCTWEWSIISQAT